MYIIAITHICLPNYEHMCFCWWPSAMTFSGILMTNRRHLPEKHQPSDAANIWSAQSFHENDYPRPRCLILNHFHYSFLFNYFVFLHYITNDEWNMNLKLCKSVDDYSDYVSIMFYQSSITSPRAWNVSFLSPNETPLWPTDWLVIVNSMNRLYWGAVLGWLTYGLMGAKLTEAVF